MIFDNQVSYNTAFSCSDAMISDYSSLMFQYLMLDKPTLWMKYHGMHGAFNGRMLEQEYIIDWRWMEETEEVDGVLAFLECIRQGTDRKADMRKAVLQQELPLADGHCGQRCCDVLLEEMCREDLY